MFSVIIATNNSERWIQETLTSLIHQDFDFAETTEIIIVDDNSSDNTKSICDNFLCKYPKNYKFIENHDFTDPKELGLKYATGKQIYFIDNSKSTLVKDNLNIDSDTIFIDIYEIIDDTLYVLANIPSPNDEKIDVYVNNHGISVNNFNFPQRDKYFLENKILNDNSVEFKLPISQEKEYEIEFKCETKQLNIDFSRPCNFSKEAGYSKTKHYISILKDNKITIKKKTTGNWIKQEFKSIIKMLKERKPGYKVGIPFRIAYMLGYPFLKNKRIWFFMDRPEISDDNAMHLFKYASDKDPNIKKYFILNKDSKDYSEMKKIGNVLGFKSIKHRYLGLFVENIVTTHPDNNLIYPFWGSYPHFAGLLKSSTMFLQHGIIKDDISSWLNKYNMNLSFFLTSSRQEYESIFKYPYHYDKSVVQLLGLPRYDHLENEKNKKQIIIMPSWRRYLTGETLENIKKTEFFKRFNSLINNEKLIKKAQEKNYEIIFRPHPNVYRFIDLFDENDYVKIDYEQSKYQNLFNNGSLLITDYSSVAFDFAYLYKPVLYYQYGDDYHFDLKETFFDYETMGLGEVCNSEDSLIELIIEYIENDCEIKEKYSKRISDFYLYTDKNNCKRVYDAIKKIQPKD